MMWLAVVALLLTIGVGCARVGHWHQQESAYWSHIALLVTLDPKHDLYYRPILVWAQANRPSLATRLRGWRSPEVRKAETS